MSNKREIVYENKREVDSDEVGIWTEHKVDERDRTNSTRELHTTRRSTEQAIVSCPICVMWLQIHGPTR